MYISYFIFKTPYDNDKVVTLHNINDISNLVSSKETLGIGTFSGDSKFDFRTISEDSNYRIPVDDIVFDFDKYLYFSYECSVENKSLHNKLEKDFYKCAEEVLSKSNVSLEVSYCYKPIERYNTDPFFCEIKNIRRLIFCGKYWDLSDANTIYGKAVDIYHNHKNEKPKLLSSLLACLTDPEIDELVFLDSYGK